MGGRDWVGMGKGGHKEEEEERIPIHRAKVYISLTSPGQNLQTARNKGTSRWQSVLVPCGQEITHFLPLFELTQRRGYPAFTTSIGHSWHTWVKINTFCLICPFELRHQCYQLSKHKIVIDWYVYWQVVWLMALKKHWPWIVEWESLPVVWWYFCKIVWRESMKQPSTTQLN